MPKPKPRDNEAGNEFIARCMSDDIMNEEYPEDDQRLAVCFEVWGNRNKQEDNNVEIERKTIQIKLKEDKEGSFVARVATLNVIDKDGDVTLNKAFPNKRVLISSFQHASWQGGLSGLPSGDAVIKEDGDEAIADGDFNLLSDSGKQHYETIKFSPDLIEWSYGFKILEEGSELEIDAWAKDHDGARPTRIIKRVDPIEISPVLLGAGVGTATLAIKNQGTTYVEQAEAVLAAVTDLTARTKSLADLRRKDDRNLSTQNIERITELIGALEETAIGLKEITVAPEPDIKSARKLVLDYLRLQNQIAEVL